MVAQTNLIVMFSSEGEVPTQVTNRLKMLNFRPAQGSVDYVYTWDHKPSIDELITLADKVCAVLKGAKVYFNLETIET